MQHSVTDFIRKNIRLNGFDYKTGYAYFVTICTNNKEKYFLNKEIAEIVESSLDFRIAAKEVTVICYCIMPDHLHMLFSLNESYSNNLSSWVSSFKRYISNQMNTKFGIKEFWHVNYYDHIVRNDESLENIAEYILNNPVRKQMVKDWTEYPYSKIKI